MKGISRRQAVLIGLAAPLIPMASGCRASLPPWSTADAGEARSLLAASATAHGVSALPTIADLNVSYSGQWRRLVQKLQPALVDAGFRGGSEERLLLREGVIAQSHVGPKGHKRVIRTYPSGGQSSVRVWFNDVEAHDRDRIDAAALVVDAYALFLLGPILLAANEHPRRDIQVALAGTAKLTQENKTHLCDLLNMKISPGIGNCESDQLVLYIDRESRLMRRVRMTLNGLESTQGALVDIDTFEHQSMHGILWPTSFHERLQRPLPLDVHAWRLTGLDINRGEALSDFNGPQYTGKAADPASSLARS